MQSRSDQGPGRADEAVVDSKQDSTTIRTRTKAFSLVELLVVMAIISILVALSLPVFQKAFNKAKKLQKDHGDGQKTILQMSK